MERSIQGEAMFNLPSVVCKDLFARFRTRASLLKHLNWNGGYGREGVSAFNTKLRAGNTKQLNDW